jgi:hypothetical protein
MQVCGPRFSLAQRSSASRQGSSRLPGGITVAGHLARWLPAFVAAELAVHRGNLGLSVRLYPLGRVDKPEPEPDGGEQDEAEEAGVVLIVAGGDAAAVLEAIEAPLDAIAQRIDAAVD